jgi:hypothetical protein
MRTRSSRTSAGHSQAGRQMRLPSTADAAPHRRFQRVLAGPPPPSCHLPSCYRRPAPVLAAAMGALTFAARTADGSAAAAAAATSAHRCCHHLRSAPHLLLQYVVDPLFPVVSGCVAASAGRTAVR